MYALFLILNDVYMLDEVHEVFYECEVGATTMDSVGLGKVLLEHNINMMLFTSVRRILEGDKPYNKTIISVIKEEEKLQTIIKKIQTKLGDISKPGVGFMFVVPVHAVYGFQKDNEEES